MPELYESRLALIAMLAQKSPCGHIGRTALMKYLYFLQTLRGVNLRYRFTLYSYGPFDSEVLADLGGAETMNAVKSEPVYFSGGYGYEIRPASGSDWLSARASEFLKKHAEDIDWVLQQFGTLSSSQLELVSTIIYVDREAAAENEKIKLLDLVDRVHEVKPHFSGPTILSSAENLAHDNLLQNVT